MCVTAGALASCHSAQKIEQAHLASLNSSHNFRRRLYAPVCLSHRETRMYKHTPILLFHGTEHWLVAGGPHGHGGTGQDTRSTRGRSFAFDFKSSIVSLQSPSQQRSCKSVARVSLPRSSTSLRNLEMV